jgi:predicted DNA-binding transcriptional regulator AlpA
LLISENKRIIQETGIDKSKIYEIIQETGIDKSKIYEIIQETGIDKSKIYEIIQEITGILVQEIEEVKNKS